MVSFKLLRQPKPCHFFQSQFLTSLPPYSKGVARIIPAQNAFVRRYVTRLLSV